MANDIRKGRTLVPGDSQTGGSNIYIDRQLKALSPGKRESAGGSIYYEYRRNRSDLGDDEYISLTKAPVKKVAVKKTAVKKAPVKKAPVKKAPVKKAPEKKAPVKKAPVKKAPVKMVGKTSKTIRDTGSTPLGGGMYKMYPSGDVVDRDEFYRRIPPVSMDTDRSGHIMGYTWDEISGMQQGKLIKPNTVKPITVPRLPQKTAEKTSSVSKGMGIPYVLTDYERKGREIWLGKYTHFLYGDDNYKNDAVYKRSDLDTMIKAASDRTGTKPSQLKIDGLKKKLRAGHCDDIGYIGFVPLFKTKPAPVKKKVKTVESDWREVKQGNFTHVAVYTPLTGKKSTESRRMFKNTVDEIVKRYFKDSDRDCEMVKDVIYGDLISGKSSEFRGYKFTPLALK